MRVAGTGLLGVALLALLAAFRGADGPRDVTVSWLPAPPAQGSPVHLFVRPDSGAEEPTAVHGALAGQELHFEPVVGGWHALAGIPVNAQETIPLTLTTEYSGGEADHQFRRIPVSSGDFAVERLTVDRRFVDRPDSALQARIARERRAARAVQRESHETPRLWYGSFSRPLPGRVTSRFGTGREFNGQLQSRHLGVDLDGDRGDPVLAAGRGVVALVGDFYYSGRVVYLDHGRGLLTAYLHLSHVDVAQGDTLERGGLVGRVGATGRVTGPHLHWMVRYGRVSLDGLRLLALDLSGFDEPEHTAGAGAGVAPDAH
jgi:murein DD-endopeptidase MepM/ murein hydrolase activator NlpD